MNHLSFFIIPILGLLKNLVKYKNINIFLFFRTPIINYIFFYFNNDIFYSILFERYFMFIYKIIFNLLNNTYHKKKYKYIQKYNIKYLPNQ